MPRTSARRPSRLLASTGVAVLVTAGLATGGGALAGPSEAEAASQQQLEQLRGKIGSARGKVEAKKRRERVLTADVRRYSSQIGGLQGKIDVLQGKQDAVQADLDRSQAELTRTQAELRTERARLVRLQARLKESREILAARLVELYQADKPDLVSVVVSARGFSDLVERGEFLARIGAQDQRVMETVKAAKADAVGTEKKLAVLERGQRSANDRIESRRNEVVQVKGRLVSARSSMSEARASRKTLLKSVRGDRHDLEEHLDGLEKEESKIQSQLSGMPSGGGGIKKGSGALDWPADGQFTSPFGYRWGRLHGGIDIAVPVGTPVHAAAAGTVRIAGWVGGYGNYVCIDHGGGLSTCYGHNSRLGVTVGQKVAKGQVVAASGNTGNSTGPHIHFETRVGGVQKDPMGYL
ncbi:peptidoglycan DD-metalloendopeptidase family protein [Patulibacter sp. NPDC049589]|uniref:murein hydrolase activator EnvC family protein n=1 Tax=Patulibacter sp. NPDC049589 TaxID=3154731 RepID=UPI0034426990